MQRSGVAPPPEAEAEAEDEAEPPEAAEDLPLREASLGAPPAVLTWLDLEERLEAVAEAADCLSEDP